MKNKTFTYIIITIVIAVLLYLFIDNTKKEKEQNELMYLPKVALRTLLVMATGFVVLPFLSYLFNKDIAGNITGVNLFKKPFGI